MHNLVIIFHDTFLIFNSSLGTGKTFIGALLARIIFSNTSMKILCVCYTNHALDQFLEELLEKGVNDIVRIGIMALLDCVRVNYLIYLILAVIYRGEKQIR